MGAGNFVVRSAQGDYPVTFHRRIRDALVPLVALPRALLLLDDNVLRLHADGLAALDGPPARVIHATEAAKSWAGIGNVLDWMSGQGCDRRTHLVAVGGGIVQDIAAFCAHVYHRGIPYHLVPTTLLAQADSCIGAKCGVNLAGGKQQVGAFHAPASVCVAWDFLGTLHPEDVQSGRGEILKLHLIGSDLAALDTLATAFARDRTGMHGAIRTALSIKRGIIERDEHDAGERLLLNYGHTFGHALEAVTGFAVPHGIAVAWGIDAANFVAWRLGQRYGKPYFDAVHAFVARHMPYRRPDIDAAALLAAVAADKKRIGREIRMALPTGDGMMVVRVELDALPAIIAEYLEAHDVYRGK